MRISTISQIQIGTVSRQRTGDVLNSLLLDPSYNRFRFSVAYMRTSGLLRLSNALDNLLHRGGTISGSIGIDDGITSIEALEKLCQISLSSTIYYTISQYIFHPKLYVLDGPTSAVVIIGSPNLTRDGLFRNVELATKIELDFNITNDLIAYHEFDRLLNELLNTANPNVQRLNIGLINTLKTEGLVKHEASSPEPGQTPHSTRRMTTASPGVRTLFPALSVPSAPPTSTVTRIVTTMTTTRTTAATMAPATTVPPLIATTPLSATTSQTFVMKLSPFDSSHRTGVKGTAEVLIPHAVIPFFPGLAVRSSKYPDVFFDVALNTPTGIEIHNYRLWYYEMRANGTRIDEYRLRMDKETIDLTTLGGGDLLAISKMVLGSTPAYEVTILKPTDPTYGHFLSLCTNTVNGKMWGIA